jgi:hypothetical protein
MEDFVRQYCSILLHKGHTHLFLDGILINDSITVEFISTLYQVQDYVHSFDVLGFVGKLSFDEIMVLLIH